MIMYPLLKELKNYIQIKEIIICPPPQKNYYMFHSLLAASCEKDFYRFKWNQIKYFQFPNEYNGFINPWKI